MKKLLIPTIWLGLALSLGACATTHYDTIDVRRGRSHVYNMSYEEGEKQIHQVAKTREKEDCWLFIDGTWYDLGLFESKKGVYFSIKSLEKLIKKHPPKSGIIIGAHPHSIKNVPYDLVYPPSPQDVVTHTKFKKELKEKFNVRLISRVYDGHGVWEFDATEHLGLLLNTPDKKRDAKLRHEKKEIETKWLYAVRGILYNEGMSRREKIKRYIKAVKDFGLIHTYKSLE